MNIVLKDINKVIDYGKKKYYPCCIMGRGNSDRYFIVYVPYYELQNKEHIILNTDGFNTEKEAKDFIINYKNHLKGW